MIPLQRLVPQPGAELMLLDPPAVFVSILAACSASSFSQGFFLFAVEGCDSCPLSRVSGTSFTPGIGSPFVISSTIWLKDVGYGAGGSEPGTEELTCGASLVVVEGGTSTMSEGP